MNESDETKCSLHDAYLSVLGGVGALNSELYLSALRRVAEIAGREYDIDFKSEVLMIEKELQCRLIERKPMSVLDGNECLQYLNVDALIEQLEKENLGFSLDHTANRFREARVWKWPHVVGRYRPAKQEPLLHMLQQACLRGEDGQLK